MATVTSLMTAEEFLALPDDGVERELIRGELRERPMTTRNVSHSLVLINLGCLIRNWLRQQPHPRGLLVGGEARVRIRRGPDTIVGVDLAYFSAEVAARTPFLAHLVDSPPTLAIEILSPKNTHEEIGGKVQEYLETGTPQVWVVDPRFATVTVYRPDAKPELFNDEQELSAEPHLPGLRIPVAEVFAP